MHAVGRRDRSFGSGRPRPGAVDGDGTSSGASRNARLRVARLRVCGPEKWGFRGRAAKSYKETARMLLADDFFLIAHDDRDGRARLSPKSIELGLAGALIGELVLEQRIFVEGPRLRLISRDPPSDALAHTTLATMLAEPQHREVRTWLAYLGQTAVDAIGQRLVRAGIVQQQQIRKLLRTTVRYPANHINLP